MSMPLASTARATSSNWDLYRDQSQGTAESTERCHVRVCTGNDRRPLPLVAVPARAAHAAFCPGGYSSGHPVWGQASGSTRARRSRCGPATDLHTPSPDTPIGRHSGILVPDSRRLRSRGNATPAGTGVCYAHLHADSLPR